MAIIGEAQIRVRPVTTGFAADVQRQLAPQLAKVERGIGTSFAAGAKTAGATFGAQTSKAIAATEGVISAQAKQAGVASGRSFGSGFGEGFAALAAFAIAARIGRAFRDAAQSFLDFEVAFAGVRRVVQGSEEQIAALEGVIRDMAQELPFAATEIANVTQQAAQLGVSTGSLERFTETVLKLGRTTNLSSEEAAEGLARLAAVLQVPLGQINALASALVQLGNTSGVTESEILSLGQSLAGAAGPLGLTADQVLGLAAGIRRVGGEFEAGASATTRAIDVIQQAARTGGEQLSVLAQITNTSREEFAKLVEDNSAQAYVEFLRALSRAGDEQIDIFTALNLNQIRFTRELRAQASGVGFIAAALDNANRGFTESTALNREFAIFAGLSANQLQVLQNQIEDVRISLGRGLVPVLKVVTATFASLGPATVGLGGSFLGLVAAGFVVTRFVNILRELSKTLGTIPGVGGRAVVALKALGIAAAVAAAIDILSASIEQFQNKVDPVRNDIDQLSASLLKVAPDAGALAGSLDQVAASVQSVRRFDVPLLDFVLDDVERLINAIPGIGRTITTDAEAIVRQLAPVDKALLQIAEDVGFVQAQAIALELQERLVGAGEAVETVEQGIAGFNAGLNAAAAAADRGATATQILDDAAVSLGNAVVGAGGQLITFAEDAKIAADAMQFFNQASAAFDARLGALTPAFGDLVIQQDRSAQASRGAGNAAADAAKKIADAERALREAREEAAEDIADAERNLAEAQEDAIERVIDAQRRLQEVRRQGNRTFRDAQQELQDFEAALARTGGAATPEDLIRLRELREAVRDARADARVDSRDAARDVDQAREDGAEAVAEARRRLVEAEEDAADRIADAQRRLAEAYEDTASRGSAASAQLATRTANSVAALIEVFNQNAAKLNQFATLMEAASSRIFASFDRDVGEAFLAGLAELGPAAIPKLRAITNASDEELAKLIKSFKRNLKATKAAADFEFDKFPPNFAQKIGAATDAGIEQIDRLIDSFEGFADRTGPAAQAAEVNLIAFGKQLQILSEEGQIALTDVEQSFLDVGLSADDSETRVANLKELVESFRSRDIGININTKVDQDSKKFLRLIEGLGPHSSVIIKFEGGPGFAAHGATVAAAAHGATFRSGQPIIIGERGQELFIPNTGGAIFKHTDTEKILRALSRVSGGGTVQNIQVNEVAQDPRATARAVAFAIGKGAIR